MPAAQAAAQSSRLLRLPRVLRLALLAALVARSLLAAGAVVAWMEPRQVWPLGRWLSVLTGAQGAAPGGEAGRLGLGELQALAERNGVRVGPV